jgi:hypothetical protein
MRRLLLYCTLLSKIITKGSSHTVQASNHVHSTVCRRLNWKYCIQICMIDLLDWFRTWRPRFSAPRKWTAPRFARPTQWSWSVRRRSIRSGSSATELEWDPNRSLKGKNYQRSSKQTHNVWGYIIIGWIMDVNMWAVTHLRRQEPTKRRAGWSLHLHTDTRYTLRCSLYH